MNFRNKPREELDLNLTPLIDVVFLLLIFFMVSTTFERESEIAIALPEASDAPAEANNNSIIITISSDQRYFVNREEVVNRKLVSLRRAIQAAANNIKGKPILVINADKATPHQAVILAMDAVRQLGYANLTFATARPAS
jgi:biopolymer transport protein ExbD